MKRFSNLIFSISLVAAAAITATGCATLSDAQSERGEGGAGTIKTYEAGFDEVWDTVVNMIQDSVLEIVVNDKQKGEILAQRSISLF